MLVCPVAFAEAVPAPGSTLAVESSMAEPVAKPASRSGFKLIPLGNADLRGGWTAVDDGKGALGLVGSAMLLPAVQLPGKAGIILPIYAFNGSLSDRVIEESILFETRQTHMVSLGYKKIISGDWDVKASADGSYALTQQTRDEKFGKGLYDYRDLGGRTSVTWSPKREGREEPVSLGFRYFRRAYPNYKSLALQSQNLLAALPSGGAGAADKEKNPKNYTGIELSASGERWLSETLKGRLDYTLGLQPYTDRYLRTDQGLVSGKKRSDVINQGAGRVDWTGLETAVVWTSLDLLHFGSNGSNYDPGQADYPFTRNFYQFYDLNWRSGVSVQLPFGESLHPRVDCGVGLGMRRYDRHAQDVAGQNLKPTQADNTLAANLGTNIPLNKVFGISAGLSWQKVTSNNKFERYVKYSYDLTAVSLGMTAKF
jgi:hypothetical protein